MQNFKEDNERVLKAQEELNNVLLTKIHNNEEEKNKRLELNMAITAPYKRKVRKLKFSNHKIESSSE